MARNLAILFACICFLVGVLDVVASDKPTPALVITLGFATAVFLVIAFKFSHIGNFRRGALVTNIIGGAVISYALYLSNTPNFVGTNFYYAPLIVASTLLCGRIVGGGFLVFSLCSMVLVYLGADDAVRGNLSLSLSSFLDRLIAAVVLFYLVCLAEKTLKMSLDLHLEQEQKLRQGERLSTLGVFASGMAHEIRNPLAIINSGVSILANPSLQGEARQKRVDVLVPKIESSVSRISDIIDSVIYFSGESLVSEIDSTPKTSLNEAVKEALSQVGSKIDEKNIQIEQDLMEDDFLLPGSRFHLMSVIHPILANAVDAVEEDAKADSKIYIASRVEDYSLIFSIRDNGVGIPEHLQKDIFDPFFTTKKVGRGTGMGISIARGIASRLGWEIRFTSKPGETEFCLIIDHYKLVELNDHKPAAS